VLSLALIALLAQAQQQQERPVPPPGVAIPAEERGALEQGLAQLDAALKPLEKHTLAPDIRIFRDAVRTALQHNEFFNVNEFAKAKSLLSAGMDRAHSLARGEAPWTTQSGLVVRGYISNIDGSVQPYGLVIPSSWTPTQRGRWRLDTWFHGRGETLSEVNFLDERMKRPGEFTPRDTFVLHLYGRYCNANRFAGEVDLFEALADVKKHYAIDDNRIILRGFSMGGAATWSIAAHYPGLWAAAAPGAGFSETTGFLKLNPNDFPDWQRKLWRLHDATGLALNFYNLPLVAYSGEIDGQKQAADIMAAALVKEGLDLTHIIGPNTPHRYHPDSKTDIEQRLDSAAAAGRDPYPSEIRFVTHSLKYNRMKWLIIDGLDQHWEQARINAKLISGGFEIKTVNVSAFTLDYGAGGSPYSLTYKPTVIVDGTILAAPPAKTDRSWRVSFVKSGNGAWKLGTPEGLRKQHGLQGPIDDAFMSRFIMVTPTGAPMSKAVGERIANEQARAIREWRKQFRGDAMVRKDSEITDADVASSNLVLWGDPRSNRVLARIAAKLPVEWTETMLKYRGQTFDSTTHMPVLIFPNPLNPSKYVVLNSGFTFREFDYLNNARQHPHLPDWAMIDVTAPADGNRPGHIATAGFFDERWQ
jgi:dienelactone hydrolase